MTKIVSPKAELTVLRGLCSKDLKVSGTLVSGVDESYFHSEESVELYQAILRHIGETGRSPTYKLLIEDPDLSEEARDHMRDSQPLITTPEEAKKAVRILNKYRQARGLVEVSNTIALEMKKSKVDTDAVLQKVAEQLNIVRAKKTSEDAFLHFGKNNNSLKIIDDILYGDQQEELIPTGFNGFDKESGGFARGSLVTIASNSGGGKSVCSSQLLKNMAERGYKVLLVPLEMSKWQMTARIMANVANFDLGPIIQKRLTESEAALIDKKMKRWLKKVKKRGGRYTIFKPTEDLTIEEIYASISAFGCDVVIIDYVSLLKGMDDDDQWRRLGAAARYGKINAENMNRVNILVCQLSDEGKIRYSRAITEHSSNSWVWQADRETKEGGLLRFEQPKSRNSESFPFSIRADYKRMRMWDAEIDDTMAETVQDGSSDKEEKKKKKRKDDLPNLAVDV